jgi:hypothetical protein
MEKIGKRAVRRSLRQPEFDEKANFEFLKEKRFFRTYSAKSIG